MTSIVTRCRAELELTNEALDHIREQAVIGIENSQAGDDCARLEAWAMMRAVSEIRRILNGPIETLSIIEASKKDRTS